jgi:hypothetical protein
MLEGDRGREGRPADDTEDRSMSLLDARPRCDCCPTQRAFIRNHIDCDRMLYNHDDPGEVVDAFDTMREDFDCGVTIAEMREYLRELPDRE